MPRTSLQRTNTGALQALSHLPWRMYFRQPRNSQACQAEGRTSESTSTRMVAKMVLSRPRRAQRKRDTHTPPQASGPKYGGGNHHNSQHPKQRGGPLSRAVSLLQAATTPDEILTVIAQHGYDATFRTSHIVQGLLRLAKSFVPASASRARKEFVADDARLQELLQALLRRTKERDFRPVQATDTLLALALLYPKEVVNDGTGEHYNNNNNNKEEKEEEEEEGQCWRRQLQPQLLGIINRDQDLLTGFECTNLAWACRKLGIDTPEGVAARQEQLPFQHVQQAFTDIEMERLLEEIEFNVDEVGLNLGGKRIKERRMTAWQSDSNKPFEYAIYSGKIMEPMEMTPTIERLRDEIYRRTSVRYDCALINLYPDSRSGMRFHADPDQNTLWSTNSVVVSAGDTRLFIMRQMNDHSKRHQFYVSAGDIVIMYADCQERYQHSIRTEQSSNDDYSSTVAATQRPQQRQQQQESRRDGDFPMGPRVSIVFKQSLEEWERTNRVNHTATIHSFA
eukprot:jgi/Bigna1/77192/fgenesh1_pg.46_\